MEESNKGNLNEIEIQVILDRQLRTVLNMHTIESRHQPFTMGLVDPDVQSDIIKKELLDVCDFYQPCESIKGLSMANFYTSMPEEFRQ